MQIVAWGDRIGYYAINRSSAMSGKSGLYANIAKKKKRIENGSGESMRKAGSKGAPTAKNFKESAKTAKKKSGKKGKK